MSDLPNPKSYEAVLADMLSTYATKQGINDFNVGSAVTSFFETVALATVRASGDVFQILRDFSVDRATGDTLKRLAIENRVAPVTAKPATGQVTVTDTGFTKKSTKIYAGAMSPNIGSTSIKVSDTTAWTATGSIYIGRGTPNIEGPIPYVSIAPSGSFFVINLSVPTTKFHNVGETVILAQGGNRSIPVNSIAVSPAVGSSSDLQFAVTTAAIILDGEVSVGNVQVASLTPGADGNVPRGAIKQFSNPPFAGAAVTNTLPFITGKDSETDDQLRVRIKRAIESRGLGTATAVKNSVIGAAPSDEDATIVSSDILSNSDGAILYIDDGSGYEAKNTGVGLEAIVNSAIGGEQFFQLSTGGRQTSVTKAFLISTLSAPFDIIDGDTLALIVGETTYQHVFTSSDFRSPGGVTANEVTASVNANPELGFEATTSGGGLYVVFRSKTEGSDNIKISTPTTSGRDASVQLGLSENETQTLRLYKNKIPLNKDGKTASVFTQEQSLWSPTIVTGDTLILLVDGTAAITYTVYDADFIATGLYTSVSSANSLDSWAEVLTAKLTGVTVSVVGQRLRITSNLGSNNRAEVVIDGASSLVTKGMLSSLTGLSAQGKASDFILSRNTAQIELAVPLVAGDVLEAGTTQTEARIQSLEIPGGSVAFSADAHIWLLIDNPGEIIVTGVAGNTIIDVTKPATNTVRYVTTIPSAFDNVVVGDYIIIWSEELNINNRLEGRVHAKTGTTLDIVVTAAEWAAAVAESGILFSEGFVILRSTLAPQKFRITLGPKTLDDITQELQDQTNSLIFSVLEDRYIVVRSRTKNTNGYVLVVTADLEGKLLNLPANTSNTSKDSLIAFYDSRTREGQLPRFVHSSFAAGSAANPPDSFTASVTSNISFAGRDPNELICELHPYGAIPDSQPYGECAQVKSIAGPVVTIAEQALIRRMRIDDRFFIANPLDFGFSDTAVVVLDNDTTAKSFEMPFYRRAVTNTSFANNPSSFNAYDVDAGPVVNFASSFGPGFDFQQFKVLMQAKKVLKHALPETALLYRSARWGRSGEKITVGYDYPGGPNALVTSNIDVSNSVDIRIVLASGAAIASAVDGSTEWDITVTPNTPIAGVDQVTYTWTGLGTNPSITLSGGEYVNITNQTEFDEANIGIFRISSEVGFTPTPTSFSVQRPTAAAVAESNKSTLVPGAISFYASASTTAADVKAYVDTDLALYVTATIVNDGGTSGSGVFVESTYEDSGFSYDRVSLLDGINWIASNDLSVSPQFTFKKPLDLSSDVGYAFNSSEEVRLVPTTHEQVKRLLSVLAVTGFTTVGTIGTTERASRLELATQILGSKGAVQIIGGLANKYEVPVLDIATRLNNTVMSVSADRVSAQGVHSDQWFRLEATVKQRKETLLSSNSGVTIIGNSPASGKSTVIFNNRELNQRYFGKPRHHVRSRGNTFRVEKQGNLVCISWNLVGTSPDFLLSAVDFNDAGGGTLNVSKVTGGNDVEYIVLTGNANFNGLSIGDLVTVANMPDPDNNGTFLVTGVSSNGKTLRVLNSASVNEFSSGTFTFSANSTAGDQFTIGITNLIAGTNFAIGATAADTAANLSAVIGTVPGANSTVNGLVVTVTANAPSSTLALAYSGTLVVTVSGASIVGQSFNASDFSASTEVSEGDTLIMSNPFAVLNQGKFLVIRRYDDSIWIENPNVVEEEVTLPANLISLGFDATTSFKVNATNHTQYLNWNGVGLEPSLGNAKVGDVVRFGTDFAVANQGNFMVISAGAKKQQIERFVMPTGAQFTIGGPGKYFLLNSAGDVNQYYVWFNINGSNSDPAPGGLTPVLAAILSGDSSAQVAAKTALAITGTSDISATSLNNEVTSTTSGFQETTAASNFNVPAPFTAALVQAGKRSFLEATNPSAVNEAAVFVIGSVLEDHRPQMQFLEIEASVFGDKVVATGDTLTLSNAGSWVIDEVIDRNTAVVIGTMANVDNASLNNRESSVFVEEAAFYFGYKHVLLVSAQAGAPQRTQIVFDTNAQSSKINEAAGVQLISVNKMDFNTLIKKGLDSYRYDTGLIGEANRIVYGDPRDSTTYPGSGAAGAEIFVREPLDRRIQVSINIRIATGAPFAQLAEQVRTNVSSLINSNKIGVPIDFSSIVSVVKAVPGVVSVAISSPQYDSTHDIIFIAPGEKARILDPGLDIGVSQIGT